jgi:hypothetical protein
VGNVCIVGTQERDFSTIGLDGAGENLQKYRFAAAVGPNQSDAVPFGDGEGDIPKERRGPVGLRDPLCVGAGKSKYYDAALSNLEKAQKCYHSAGLDEQWQALVAEIRREHHRKPSFMPGFERMVRGERLSREPSFLDQARERWASRTKA